MTAEDQGFSTLHDEELKVAIEVGRVAQLMIESRKSFWTNAAFTILMGMFAVFSHPSVPTTVTAAVLGFFLLLLAVFDGYTTGWRVAPRALHEDVAYARLVVARRRNKTII